MSKILITGASGFIGGFLVEHGLSQGYEVFAGIRKTSNRRYLQDSRIKFFEVDFENPKKMSEHLAKEKFDYIIHNAGKTKAPSKSDYFKINQGYTRNFAESLIQHDCVPKKFVFISSLAAIGPADKSPGNIVDRSTPPNPITHYGESKLAAEESLKEIEELPLSIIRPTAVFGPRDADMFTIFKMLSRGLEAYIGSSDQKLSFIYVKDLVKCIFASCFSPHHRGDYLVTDGNYYAPQEFYGIIKSALGKKTVKINVPVWMLRIIATGMERMYGSGEKLPPLNREKLNELTARNWHCDTEPLQSELGFTPEYSLDQAVKESVEWYRANKWL